MNPVLFLDFDGVLNHSGTTTRHRGFTGLDPENIARLNAICEAVPEARIVVSSSWRLMLRYITELRGALKEFGFRYPERVVGATPLHVTNAGGSLLVAQERGHEIQAWLDAQPEQPSAIAILDDAEDMVHLAPHLVRTDMWAGGLTDAHAQAVIAKLAAVRTEAA